MKIALMLPGLSRSAERCYPALEKHLLSNYEIDIYIHTYEQTLISYDNSNKVSFDLNHDDLVKLYNPKKIIIENYEDVKNSFIEKAKKYKDINCNAEE